MYTRALHLMHKAAMHLSIIRTYEYIEACDIHGPYCEEILVQRIYFFLVSNCYKI